MTGNSLDLVFANFSRVSTFFADAGVVKPGHCHPPNVIEMPLDLQNSASHYKHSYRKYILGDYNLLFSFFSNYDWSCAYSINTTEAAVGSFSNVILQVIDLAVPGGFHKKVQIP